MTIHTTVQKEPIVLDGETLSVEQIVAIARGKARIALSPAVAGRVAASRAALEKKIARQEIIYGVTTGFGGNVNFMIPVAELEEHQRNLVHSLNCGTGPAFDVAEVRGAMALRANALVKGFSAVRLELPQRLAALLNEDITPVIPRYGSVGASGDLVPSSYIALLLSGEGKVNYRGKAMGAAEALRTANIQPIVLQAKEGLALVNGTTSMTSCAALTLYDTEYLAKLCVAIIGMTAEVLRATTDSFDPNIQKLKNHPGQAEVARLLLEYTAGSSLVRDLETLREDLRKKHTGAGGVADLEECIQTPYSLRCAPQGIGPAFDALAFARQVIEREMNSVNDNPLIDHASERVYHTGNFYGGHIARAMDAMKIDLANLGNWSHALMAMLMDPRFSNGLPPNLSLRPGLHSGFKPMQLSHTSLVTMCRQMANPSSIHTLPTEQYNQDIVSLGLHAAQGARDMTVHIRNALAILAIALSQAADLRGVKEGRERLGKMSNEVYKIVRQHVPFLAADRPQEEDVARLSDAILGQPIGL